MTQINVTLDSEILHGLFTSNGKDNAFAKLLESILNQVLNAQVSEQIGQTVMNALMSVWVIAMDFACAA